jgi:hypothetical protein
MNCKIEDADVAASSVDTLYSISTLEHLPEESLESLAKSIHRVLKPAGRAVITIDLFLDLHPFSARESNDWGSNISVRDFVEMTGLELVAGDPSELNGFAEFEPREVLGMLAEFYVGRGYPVLAQALVLEKRS